MWSEIFNGKLMKRWPRVFVNSMIRSEGIYPVIKCQSQVTGTVGLPCDKWIEVYLTVIKYWAIWYTL